jgi:hypothetical protein
MGALGLIVAPRGTNIYNGSDQTVVSLVQRGEVPANATGLIVRGSLAGIVWQWNVSMDGVNLPSVWSPQGIVVDSLAGFAGKDVDLRIDLSGSVRGRLDEIAFVPEPRDLMLWSLALMVGAVVLTFRSAQAGGNYAATRRL